MVKIIMYRKSIYIALPISILFITLFIIPLTPVSAHPSDCLKCHADTSKKAPDGRWNHEIFYYVSYPNNVGPWSNCTKCHDDYTAGTVHDDLDCMGCHAVVHKGYSDGNKWAAWIYAREPNLANNYFEAPDQTTQWVLNKTVITDGNYTTVNWGNTIKGYAAMSINVGLWNGFTNEYLEVGAGHEYKVCFTCHFISVNPASVGSYKLVGGVWKIGIPEFALSLPPHEITQSALAQASESNNVTFGPSAILGVLAGLFAVGLVVYSKREVWM